MIVPARPLIHRSFFRRATCDSDAYLRGMIFYPLGRHALLAALHHLGLKAGDTVVFPAYYCESTLGVLRDEGFRLAYVDVDDSLRPDVDGLTALCREGVVGAVVVAHYFGFESTVSAELVGLCERHGIRIIEDYSHSFLSFDPVEREPGIASAFIFSMRKTLPIPDGGALWMPGADDDKGASAPASGISTSIPFLVKGYLESLSVQVGWPNLYGSRIGRLKQLVGGLLGGSPEASGVPQSVAPSSLLHRLLCDRDTLQRTAERRRHSYRQLRTGLDGIDKLAFLYPDDAKGVPYVLPLLSSDKRLLAYLREHGIGAFPWPGEDMPFEVREKLESFPNAADINEKVVCMPVHQDVSDAHIAYMIETIRRFFAQVESNS